MVTSEKVEGLFSLHLEPRFATTTCLILFIQKTHGTKHDERGFCLTLKHRPKKRWAQVYSVNRTVLIQCIICC